MRRLVLLLAILLLAAPARAEMRNYFGLAGGLGLGTGGESSGFTPHVRGLLGLRGDAFGFALHFDAAPSNGAINLGGEIVAITRDYYVGLGGGYGSWEGRGFDSCSTCGGGVTGTMYYRLGDWFAVGGRGIFQFAFANGGMNSYLGLFADVAVIH